MQNIVVYTQQEVETRPLSALSQVSRRVYFEQTLGEYVAQSWELLFGFPNNEVHTSIKELVLRNIIKINQNLGLNYTFVPILDLEVLPDGTITQTMTSNAGVRITFDTPTIVRSKDSMRIFVGTAHLLGVEILWNPPTNYKLKTTFDADLPTPEGIASVINSPRIPLLESPTIMIEQVPLEKILGILQEHLNDTFAYGTLGIHKIYTFEQDLELNRSKPQQFELLPIVQLLNSLDPTVKYANELMPDQKTSAFLTALSQDVFDAFTNKPQKELKNRIELRAENQKFVRESARKSEVQRIKTARILLMIKQKLPPNVYQNALQFLRENPKAEKDSNILLEHLDAKQRAVIKATYETFERNSIPSNCVHVPALNLWNQRGDISQLKKYVVFSGDDITCSVCKKYLICMHEYLTATRPRDDKLRKYLLQTKFETFCRHCGGLISQQIAEGFNTSMERGQDQDLNDLIHSEITIGIMRNLKLSIPVGAFINALKQAVYGPSQTAKLQLGKNKTATPEELRNSLRFIVAIYCFAWIISYMRKFPKHVSLSNSKSEDLKANIKTASSIIYNMFTTAKTHMEITPELIVRQLVDAFKLLDVSQVEVRPPREYDISDILNIDPMYQIASLIYFLVRKKPAPKFANGEIHQKVLRDPKGPLYSQVDTNLIYKNDKFMHNVLRQIWANYELPNVLFINSENIATPTEPFKKYLENARKILKERDTEQPLRHVYSPIKDHNIRFKYQGFKLGRIMDKDGKPHRWNIAVIQGKDGNMEDVPIEKVAELSLIQRVKTWRCGICKLTKEECLEISNESIENSRNQAIQMQNFYAFYAVRCPKEGVHLKSNGVCSKCGIGGPNSVEIYKKYESEYKDDLKKLKESNTQKERKEPIENIQLENIEGDNMRELAHHLDINPRIFNSLGIEGQQFDEILSGKYIAPPVGTDSLYRVYDVAKLGPMLISAMGALKNMSDSPEFLDLYERSGIPQELLQQQLKQIPQPSISAIEFRTAMRLPPGEAFNYILNAVGRQLLKIISFEHKQTKKLRHDFVKMFTAKIVQMVSLRSKPGYFNFSLLYEDKSVSQIASVEDIEIGEQPAEEVAEGEENALVDEFDVEEETEENGVRVEGYGLD